MKQQIVSGVRRYVPQPLVRLAEEIYRRGRVHAVSAYYGYPARKLQVIAVTGTNGKTTTANYLNEILKAAGMRTAMFTTALIEVGGEQTLNELNATVASTSRMQKFFSDARRARADYVILEVTSHALDQHKLATVPIECAVMTNLTQDHLDYHKTMEGYAKAKAKLFKGQPPLIVLNSDDEWFDYFNKFEADEQKITYGTAEGSDCRIDKVKLYKKGSEVNLEIDHSTKLELATALPGKYNVYNLSAAVATAYVLQVKIDALIEGVARLEAIPGRFERIEIDAPYEVVVDYAHTPDALEKLLETARGVASNRVMLVFGATGDRDKAKRPIMGEIAAQLADRIFVTDEESYNEDPGEIRRMVIDGIEAGKGSPKAEEIADRREAIKKAMSVAKTGDVILVTGMGHENYRIVNGQRLPWNDGDVVREIAGVKAEAAEQE